MLKENQPVKLRTFVPGGKLPPADKSGQPLDPEIRGSITKLTKGHALVCFTAISEGIRLAVNRENGRLVIVIDNQIPKDCAELKVGDVEAVAPEDLIPAESASREPAAEQPKECTRAEAEQILKDVAPWATLDWMLLGGHVRQSIDGKFRPDELRRAAGMLKTFYENSRVEQAKFGDEVKEYNRLRDKLKDARGTVVI